MDSTSHIPGSGDPRIDTAFADGQLQDVIDPTSGHPQVYCRTGAISNVMSRPRANEDGDEEFVEELEDRARDVLEGEEFVTFDQHNEERDD